MHDIHITVNGTQKLLQNLDPSKATILDVPRQQEVRHLGKSHAQ